MKYLISLHFAPGWGAIFIYLSILTLLIGLALALIEDVKSGTDAQKFAKLRKRWLLPVYVFYWGIYSASLFYAQSLKSELPIYEFQLSETGCEKLLAANINFSELNNHQCRIYGNSDNELKQQRVIQIGTKQIAVDICDVVDVRTRGFDEYKTEFEKLYTSSGWW